MTKNEREHFMSQLAEVHDGLAKAKQGLVLITKEVELQGDKVTKSMDITEENKNEVNKCNETTNREV